MAPPFFFLPPSGAADLFLRRRFKIAPLRTNYRQSPKGQLCSRTSRRKGQNMSENNGRRARRGLGATGLTVVLALGITALAVIGYGKLISRQPEEKPAQGVSAAPETTEEQPLDAFVMPSQPTVQEQASAPVEPVEPAEPVQNVLELPIYVDAPVQAAVPAEPPRLIVEPVPGETVAAFSVSELRYSETLGDWRTHDGIDMAAAEGDSVVAAMSGTVVSVANDDLMGTTVVLSHDDGYQTTYANLRPDTAVTPGQYVSAGQIIGAVGSTALIESAQAPHLHFSVTKDGDAVDPEEFLRS